MKTFTKTNLVLAFGSKGLEVWKRYARCHDAGVKMSLNYINEILGFYGVESITPDIYYCNPLGTNTQTVYRINGKYFIGGPKNVDNIRYDYA